MQVVLPHVVLEFPPASSHASKFCLNNQFVLTSARHNQTFGPWTHFLSPRASGTITTPPTITIKVSGITICSVFYFPHLSYWQIPETLIVTSWQWVGGGESWIFDCVTLCHPCLTLLPLDKQEDSWQIKHGVDADWLHNRSKLTTSSSFTKDYCRTPLPPPP